MLLTGDAVYLPIADFKLLVFAVTLNNINNSFHNK